MFVENWYYRRYTLFTLPVNHSSSSLKKDTTLSQYVYLLQSTPFLNTHHPNWNSLLAQKPILLSPPNTIPSLLVKQKTVLTFVLQVWAHILHDNQGLLNFLTGLDQARLGQEGEEVLQNQLVDGLGPTSSISK